MNNNINEWKHCTLIKKKEKGRKRKMCCIMFFSCGLQIIINLVSISITMYNGLRKYLIIEFFY